MKKKCLIGSLLAIAVGCGIYAGATLTGETHVRAETANATTETTLTGMAWKNNGFCFSLSATDYQGVAGNGIPGERISEYNYSSNITVYKGETSATLGEILGDSVFYNMWTEQNTYTVQVSNEWQTGVTKVVVPKGTEFPASAYTGYTPWTEDNSASFVQPITDVKTSFVTDAEVVYTSDGNGNFIAQRKLEAEEEEIVVTNVHIRGEHKDGENRDHCFLILFLSTSDYEGSTVAIGSALFEYNFMDKIKLWTSDTEFVTLKEAYNKQGGTKEAYYNIWGERNAVAIQLGGYDYNGASFAKITIDEDCQFPSQAYTSGTETSKKTVYVQKRSAECTPTDISNPYSVITWKILIDNAVSEDLPVRKTEIAVRSDDYIGIQIRGDETQALPNGKPHCFILFYLPEDLDDFPEVDSATGQPKQVAISPSRAKNYNTLDKVWLWTSETEYITLREAYECEGGTKEMYYNIWGEEHCVAYALGGYHGESFVKITVLKDCEFPSYKFTDKELYPTERIAYVQAATIDFIDWAPDTYMSTNWRANTEKGTVKITDVSFNVSGQDNVLRFTLSGTDYPAEGDLKLATGGLESLFPNNDLFANIIIDGVAVSEYISANGKEWVNAYFNYDGYGTFAFNVPGLTKDSKISSIVFKKGFCVPAYENPEATLREYRVIYYTVDSAVEFTKAEGGEWSLQDGVQWTVTFDGANPVKVKDGEKIPANAFPADPEKEGYTFIGWYNGEREWRSSDRVSDNLDLIAKFTKNETEDSASSGTSDVVGGGCFSALDASCLTSCALFAAALCLKKRKQK